MFDVTGNKGFRITFSNGWTASVQWGGGNYCENYSIRNTFGDVVPASKDAEIAAWDKNDVWFNFGGDEVKGNVSSNDVAVFLAMIASK